LLKGQKTPDHTTINRFRKGLEDFTPDLLTQFSELLIEQGHVDLKSIYIDGTKIEAVAGWRKFVEKYQQKLKKRMIKELKLPEKSSFTGFDMKLLFENTLCVPSVTTN